MAESRERVCVVVVVYIPFPLFLPFGKGTLVGVLRNPTSRCRRKKSPKIRFPECEDKNPKRLAHLSKNKITINFPLACFSAIFFSCRVCWGDTGRSSVNQWPISGWRGQVRWPTFVLSSRLRNRSRGTRNWPHTELVSTAVCCEPVRVSLGYDLFSFFFFCLQCLLDIVKRFPWDRVGL